MAATKSKRRTRGGAATPASARRSRATARAASAAADAAPAGEFRAGSVRAKTGRPRTEWFALLDDFGAAEHGHRATVAHLMGRHGLSGWWAQAIAVEYERARGVGTVERRPQSYSVSVQRALAVPAESAWETLSARECVTRWLAPRHTQDFRVGGRYHNSAGGNGRFLRIAPPRGLRFSWEGPRRSKRGVVDVEVAPRGPDRCRVRLQHAGIGSEEEREALRLLWSRALDSFKSYVETGEPISADEWAVAR